MAKPMFGPRKQRTRQHVIADLSVHHVEGFILEEGHTTQRFSSDYSNDLVMRTLDVDGARQPRKGAKTVRLQVRIGQPVNRWAIQKIRELKGEPKLGVVP